jgi:hypothetical protein
VIADYLNYGEECNEFDEPCFILGLAGLLVWISALDNKYIEYEKKCKRWCTIIAPRVFTALGP